MTTHPIAVYLKQQGLTQVQLARQVGVHDNYINYIINSHRWPSYNLAVKLSRITGIAVDKLLTFNRPR